MNHVLNHSLAAIAAFVIAISSIGTIVTVPPAQAAVPVTFELPPVA